MAGPAITGWTPAGGGYQEMDVGDQNLSSISITLQAGYLVGAEYLIAFALYAGYGASSGDPISGTWDTITSIAGSGATGHGAAGYELIAYVRAVTGGDDGSTVIDFANNCKGAGIFYVNLGDQAARFDTWGATTQAYEYIHRIGGSPDWENNPGLYEQNSIGDSVAAPSAFTGDTTWAVAALGTHVFLRSGSDPTPTFDFDYYVDGFIAPMTLTNSTADKELGYWDNLLLRQEDLDANAVVPGVHLNLQVDLEDASYASINTTNNWISDLQFGGIQVYPTFTGEAAPPPADDIINRRVVKRRLTAKELPFYLDTGQLNRGF